MSESSADTRQANGAQIAYRIRAELVCCNLYGRVNDSGDLTFEQAQQSHDWHDLCYWGEASARIAETPAQWAGDPDECGYGCPPQCRHQRASDGHVSADDEQHPGKDCPTKNAVGCYKGNLYDERIASPNGIPANFVGLCGCGCHVGRGLL